MTFDRASEHLDAFESAAKAWREVSAHAVRKDIDPQIVRDMVPDHPMRSDHPDAVGVELQFRERYSIDPNWALILNEAIHGLRISLDHLAYALACANTEGPLPSTVAQNSAFPAWNSEPSPVDLRKQIGAIHPDAQAIIKSFQPYNPKPPGYESICGHSTNSTVSGSIGFSRSCAPRSPSTRSVSTTLVTYLA
jgi:hypothetical protein